jgi:Permease family
MMGIFVIDGAVIVVLVVLGLREPDHRRHPYDLKLAIGIGIGAFITVVGLKNAGFVVSGGELGTLGDLHTWKMLVFVVGLLATWTFYERGVKGALLIGIVGATVLSTVINAIDGYHIWTDGTARLPQGSWLTTPNLALADGSGVSFHFALLGVGSAIAVILAVVMSDLFDNVGTSVSVGRNAGMLDAEGRLPRIRTALGIDGFAAMLGGFMSASSNTTFIESNAGVAAGARTGLASVVTGVLLLLCMFISPIAGIIPTEARPGAGHRRRDDVRSGPRPALGQRLPAGRVRDDHRHASHLFDRQRGRRRRHPAHGHRAAPRPAPQPAADHLHGLLRLVLRARNRLTRAPSRSGADYAPEPASGRPSSARAACAAPSGSALRNARAN